MNCCLETAMLNALRDLGGTPIRSDNHFDQIRKCKDCLPYLVLKVTSSAGLRTSSGLQKIHTIDISAYFSGDNEQAPREYRDLVEDWLNTDGCVELGDCGCICVQGDQSSRITAVTESNLIRFQLTFRGVYQQAEFASASASASASV